MKKIFLLAIATFALTSCNNDENFVADPTVATITATIGEPTLTRASDSKWTPGDEIGISSTVGSVVGRPYSNLRYTTEKGDGIFSGTKIYFYSPMTLTAYYPFTGEEGNAPGTDGVITAETRVTNQDPERQPKIDFLWDSKTGVDKKDFSASDTIVNFVFAHKMSKVTFTFQSSDPVYDEKTGVRLADGVAAGNLVRYKINNLVLEGTFDTNTGVCAINDIPAEPLSIDVEKVKDLGKIKEDVTVLPLIIFPQTISGGSTTLDIYTDELNNPENLQHYKCSLAFSNGEIKPGYHYKYTIKVTKIGLIVGEMTVVPWKEENRFMTATIDGDDNVFN